MASSPSSNNRSETDSSNNIWDHLEELFGENPSNFFRILSSLSDNVPSGKMLKAINLVKDEIVVIKVLTLQREEPSKLARLLSFDSTKQKESEIRVFEKYLFSKSNEVAIFWLEMEYCQMGTLHDITRITRLAFSQGEIAFILSQIFNYLLLTDQISCKSLKPVMDSKHIFLTNQGVLKLFPFPLFSTSNVTESLTSDLIKLIALMDNVNISLSYLLYFHQSIDSLSEIPDSNQNRQECDENYSPQLLDLVNALRRGDNYDALLSESRIICDNTNHFEYIKRSIYSTRKRTIENYRKSSISQFVPDTLKNCETSNQIEIKNAPRPHEKKKQKHSLNQSNHFRNEASDSSKKRHNPASKIGGQNTSELSQDLKDISHISLVHSGNFSLGSVGSQVLNFSKGSFNNNFITSPRSNDIPLQQYSLVHSQVDEMVNPLDPPVIACMSSPIQIEINTKLQTTLDSSGMAAIKKILENNPGKKRFKVRRISREIKPTSSIKQNNHPIDIDTLIKQIPVTPIDSAEQVKILDRDHGSNLQEAKPRFSPKTEQTQIVLQSLEEPQFLLANTLALHLNQENSLLHSSSSSLSSISSSNSVKQEVPSPTDPTNFYSAVEKLKKKTTPLHRSHSEEIEVFTLKEYQMHKRNSSPMSKQSTTATPQSKKTESPKFEKPIGGPIYPSSIDVIDSPLRKEPFSIKRILQKSNESEQNHSPLLLHDKMVSLNFTSSSDQTKQRTSKQQIFTSPTLNNYLNVKSPSTSVTASPQLSTLASNSNQVSPLISPAPLLFNQAKGSPSLFSLSPFHHHEFKFIRNNLFEAATPVSIPNPIFSPYDGKRSELHTYSQTGVNYYAENQPKSSPQLPKEPFIAHQSTPYKQKNGVGSKNSPQNLCESPFSISTTCSIRATPIASAKTTKLSTYSNLSSNPLRSISPLDSSKTSILSLLSIKSPSLQQQQPPQEHISPSFLSSPIPRKYGKDLTHKFNEQGFYLSREKSKQLYPRSTSGHVIEAKTRSDSNNVKGISLLFKQNSLNLQATERN